MPQPPAVEPGHDSIAQPGIGETWPDTAVDNDADDERSIATAPVDPNNPALRSWFAEYTRGLQAERAQEGFLSDRQRTIPDFVGQPPAPDNGAAPSVRGLNDGGQE
jgi:hypothetical protein